MIQLIAWALQTSDGYQGWIGLKLRIFPGNFDSRK